MGRKKKVEQTSDYVHQKPQNYYLVGGPRDGDHLFLATPPTSFLRLPLPEWATYEFNSKTGKYDYLGSEPVPHSARATW